MLFTVATIAVVLQPGLVPQSPRARLRGTALLESEQPWPSATITLLSRPIPGDDRIGEADVVEAKSGADGSFEVEILRGRRYTVWAIEDLGDEYVVSHVLEDIGTGGRLRITASRRRTRIAVELVGLAAWKQRGKVSVRQLSFTNDVIVHDLPLSNDVARTVPMPGRSARIEVLCDGLPLLAVPERLDLTTRVTKKLVLPTPRDVLVQVVGASDKKPLASASVAIRTSDPRLDGNAYAHEIGKTDAEGFAIVTVPVTGKPPRTVHAMFAYGRGHAPLGPGEPLNIDPKHDAKQARAVKKPVHRFELPKSLGLSGKLHLDERLPASGVPLRIQTRLQMPFGPGTKSFAAQRLAAGLRVVMRTDRRGRFRLPVYKGLVYGLESVVVDGIRLRTKPVAGFKAGDSDEPLEIRVIR